MFGFSFEMKGLKEIKKAIDERLQKTMAKTLNNIADKIKGEQEKIAESSFNTFSPYTRRSLFVWKTSEKKPIAKQNIVVGSFSPYLRKLEKGFKPKTITFLAKDSRGQNQSLTGRAIATKFTRKSDGTIKRTYGLGKIRANQKVFFLSLKYGNILFLRFGKKLRALRIFKERVASVKAYDWHEKAIKKVYKPGLINEMFGKNLL